jgi:hypothetical protein
MEVIMSDPLPVVYVWSIAVVFVIAAAFCLGYASYCRKHITKVNSEIKNPFISREYLMEVRDSYVSSERWAFGGGVILSLIVLIAVLLVWLGIIKVIY